MNLVKVLLLVAFLGLFVWGFRNRARVGLRAGVRVLAFVLLVAAVVSIIVPNILQGLADLVGVTRGTDLLLYALVVLFAATTVGNYFRFRDVQRQMTAIIRAEALRDAVLSQPPPGTADDEPESPSR